MYPNLNHSLKDPIPTNLHFPPTCPQLVTQEIFLHISLYRTILLFLMGNEEPVCRSGSNS